MHGQMAIRPFTLKLKRKRKLRDIERTMIGCVTKLHEAQSSLTGSF